MTSSSGKIVFIQPDPLWDVDKSNQIVRRFLKMQSGTQFQILKKSDLNNLSQFIGQHSTGIHAFLFSFATLRFRPRQDSKILVINFIDGDQTRLKQLIGSIYCKFADLYHAYLNVFDNQEILEDLVLKGYHPDYSKDVVLKFKDELNNLKETNIQKLATCLVW